MHLQKKQIRHFLYKTRYGKLLWKLLAIITFRTAKKPTFKGWGMVTYTLTPWNNDNHLSEFEKSNNIIVKKIKNKEIILSQFSHYSNTKLWNEMTNLQWRHYIVYWSTEYVMNKVTNSNNFVECGVCDGLTIYYTILASKSKGKYFLYDSWAPMLNTNLHDTELHLEGRYSNLVIDNTKRNLNLYKDLIFYNVGFIPESFSTSNNPDSLCWLHIDINSSYATIESLLYFYPKLVDNGVILFDDYAQVEFVETKKIIDDFFLDKKGIFLHLPTGQGIFFKNN